MTERIIIIVPVMSIPNFKGFIRNLNFDIINILYVIVCGDIMTFHISR